MVMWPYPCLRPTAVPLAPPLVSLVTGILCNVRTGKNECYMLYGLWFIEIANFRQRVLFSAKNYDMIWYQLYSHQIFGNMKNTEKKRSLYVHQINRLTDNNYL